jgi:hypothetical protein
MRYFDEPEDGAVQSGPVVQWEINATSDANLSFGTGAAVQAVTNVSGSPLGSGTASGTAGPDRVTSGSGVNGVQVLEFVRANSDFIALGNALNFLRLTDGWWLDDMLLVPSLSQIQRLYSHPSSVAGLAIVTQILTTGQWRHLIRRVDSDSAVTITSDRCRFVAGRAYYAATGFNPLNGLAFFQNNDDFEVVQAGGFASGPGFFEDAAAAAAPQIGRYTSNPGGFKCARMRIGTGGCPDDFREARREILEAQFALARKKLYFDVPKRLRKDWVYQQEGGVSNEDIVITGGVSYGPDTDILLRLVDSVDLTTEGLALTNVATASGGRFTITLPAENVPVGDWVAEIRKSTDTALDAVMNTGNRIGVADRPLLIGDSWMRKAFGKDGRGVFGTTYASPDWPIALSKNQGGIAGMLRRLTYQGFVGITRTLFDSNNNTGTNEEKVGALNEDAGGNGGAVFCLVYHALTGEPVAPLFNAIGNSPGRYWKPGGQNYVFLAASIEQPGGPGWIGIPAMAWEGGRSECTGAEGARTAAEMIADMQEVFANIRAKTENPSLPIGVGIFGPIGANLIAGETQAEKDARVDEYRQATLRLIDNEPNVFVWSTSLDCDLHWDRSGSPDGLHLNPREYSLKTMPRAARNLAYALGKAGVTHGAAGPKVSGGHAAAGSNSFYLEVVHDGGTTLVDSNDDPAGDGVTIFGDTMMVDDAARGITMVSLVDGEIRIDVDGPPLVAGQEGFPRAWAGCEPDKTNVVRDDTALRVPLQPTRTGFKITVA